MVLNKKNLSIYCLLAILAITITSSVIPVNTLDATRYISVSWDMFIHHSYLIPLLNGSPYANKPPLLFWLIAGGWHVLGVSTWWARSISSIAAAITFIFTYLTAKTAWPDNKKIGWLAVLLLLASMKWLMFVGRVRFDVIFTCFTMMAYFGMVRAAQDKPLGWLWFAIGSCLAMLTKGPAFLFFLLPPAILAPYWVKNIKQKHWYRYFIGALLISLALSACWAIPAWHASSHGFAKNIVWQQTFSRINFLGGHHFRDHYPWYYYAYHPRLLLPFLIWPAFYRGIYAYYRSKGKDLMARGLLIALIIGLLLFSFVGAQKAERYLIPGMPLLALWLAHTLQTTSVKAYDKWPFLFLTVLGTIALIVMCFLPNNSSTPIHWYSVMPALVLAIFWFIWQSKTFISSAFAISLTMVFGLSCYNLGWLNPYAHIDFRPVAQKVSALQQQGIIIAFAGDYDGQLNYPGHLQKPIIQIPFDQTLRWAKQHPHAWLTAILKARDLQQLTHQPVLKAPYPHHQYVTLWQSEQINKNKGL